MSHAWTDTWRALWRPYLRGSCGVRVGWWGHMGSCGMWVGFVAWRVACRAYGALNERGGVIHRVARGAEEA